jgi:hypothetical protein
LIYCCESASTGRQLKHVWRSSPHGEMVPLRETSVTVVSVGTCALTHDPQGGHLDSPRISKLNAFSLYIKEVIFVTRNRLKPRRVMELLGRL